MKKLMVLIAILAMVLSINTVFADETKVDVKSEMHQTTNVTTNANANASASASASATGGAGGHGGAGGAGGSVGNVSTGDVNNNIEGDKINVEGDDIKIENPRQFLNAPEYPGFVSSGVAVINDGWKIYCPPGHESFTAEELERMSKSSEPSDIFFWNWEKRVRITNIGNPLPSKNKDTPIFCMNPVPAEKPLAIVRVMGRSGWSEEAFRAKASLECFNKYGSTRVPVLFQNHKDSLTRGRSLGLGGAAAQVSSAEGTVAAVGGQIGDNRVRSEEYPEFEALCLGDGYDIVSQTTQIVAPSCDSSPIYTRINQLLEGVKHCCKDECLNNELLWKQIGDAYIDLYVCTGDKKFLLGTNKKLPDGASLAYARSEKNFLEGKEPDGTRTRDLEGAQEIVREARYNWAGCIYEIHGHEKAMEFKEQKNLERIPTGFTR